MTGPEAQNGSGDAAADKLRSVIERIEGLEHEKAEIGDEVKAVYAEAKGMGFNTKMIRTMIKLRKLEEAERQESEHLRVLYKGALGMMEDPAALSKRPVKLGLAPSAPTKRQTAPSTKTKH